MKLLKKWAAFMAAHRNYLVTLGVGLLGNKLMVWLFELVLYPYVIWRYGVLKGGVIMTVLSFLVCYATLRFYDWSKRDWIGIELIKTLKTDQLQNGPSRLVVWALRKGDVFAFFFLSLKFDPLITVLYLREGAHRYNGLNKRDWSIFLASIIVGNLYWVAIAWTGVKVLVRLWKKAF